MRIYSALLLFLLLLATSWAQEAPKPAQAPAQPAVQTQPTPTQPPVQPSQPAPPAEPAPVQPGAPEAVQPAAPATPPTAPPAPAAPEAAAQPAAPTPSPTVAAPDTTSRPAAPLPSVTDNKAWVYIYRYKQFVGSALEPSVFCDEAQLARMDNGRYFLIKLDPGPHVFRSNDKQSAIELELKPGQKYYVRVEIAAGFFKGHGRVTLVAPEQGAPEVKKLKVLGADKIVNTQLVVPDEEMKP